MDEAALPEGGPLVTRPVAGAADLFSGGGFGPEASIAALLVSLLASVVILRIAWTRGDFRTSSDPQLNGKFATTS